MKHPFLWVGCAAAIVLASSLAAAALAPADLLFPRRRWNISVIEAARPRVHLVGLHPAQIVISPREMFYSGPTGVDGQFLAPPWARFAFTTTMVRVLPLLATLTPAPAPAATPASPILFPPDPPALGSTIPARDSQPAGNGAAPAELAAYVNECFYAPLAARLVATSPSGKLSDTLRDRLDSYRATKVALQTELRAKLDTLRDADAATREVRLAEFARVQTPRIAGLELIAEQLRHELAAGATPGGPPALAADSDRLRYVAFFQEGPSPAQRRLLRAIAVESAGNVKSTPGAAEPSLLLPPAGSKIQLPADLPPELTAKIAAYQREKSALEQELRAVVGATTAPSEQVFTDLADRQAARWMALNDLAESIRRGVTVRKDPARAPDLPPISPELEARITTYRQDKLDLQKALLEKVEEVSKGPPSADLQEKIRDAIAVYTRENAARYASLEDRKAAIRTDLARLPSPAAGPAHAVSADVLIAKFAEAQHEREVWWNYRYYQIAVLQPGLSPEQRRLLFDGALEDLALPLPSCAPPP